MEIEISWIPDGSYHPKTFALMDYDPIEWKVNPDRKPTEQELSACPKIFTCFSCSRKTPAERLGGREHDKWFCQECIPFIDEWTAGVMVKWSTRRKPKTFGFPGHSLDYDYVEKLHRYIVREVIHPPKIGEGDEFLVTPNHDGEGKFHPNLVPVHHTETKTIIQPRKTEGVVTKRRTVKVGTKQSK